MSPEAEAVYTEAVAHDGRYLIPSGRLYDRPEKGWCEELVFGGYAMWIPPYSDMAPGIVLTGKPLHVKSSQPARPSHVAK